MIINQAARNIWLLTLVAKQIGKERPAKNTSDVFKSSELTQKP